MKEYRLAKGRQVFLWILFPVIMLSGVFVLFQPLFPDSEKFELNRYLFLATIGLAMIVFCLFGIRELIVHKIVITESAIMIRSALYTRQLEFDEIMGFTILNNVLTLKPNRKDRKKITISSYTGNYRELEQALRARFIDLDQQALEEDRVALLQDDTFGITEEDRNDNLKQAVTKAKIVNGAGLLVAAWVWFYPNPYDVAMIVSACVLIAAVVVVRTSGGLIKFGTKKNSSYPSVSAAVILSSLCFAIRGLLDFELYDSGPLWLPMAVVALIMLVVLFPGAQERKNHPAVFVETIIASVAFAYGSVVFYNCYYDKSQPAEHNVAVKSKSISSGKSTTYYLAVTKWGNRGEGEDMTVSKNEYERVNVGDTVAVYLSKGKLGIPWIWVWTR